jgi:Asp-tRNA(Asn)/Glu-tRNA(Gln) amidotransferase A subunit family amidase
LCLARAHVPGAAAGPLAGLSFAVKDLIDVASVPTGGGNPDWPCFAPTPIRHAWAVQTLLDAGASVTGKTRQNRVCRTNIQCSRKPSMKWPFIFFLATRVCFSSRDKK